MIISSNLGTIDCPDFIEYKAQMEKCIEHSPGNEIWCSREEGCNSYPCLSILIKGEMAVVNYFSEGNSKMFVSLGDESRDGTVEFENGQYDIAVYQIISAAEALNCALEFFYSQEKPSVIRWDEL